MKNVKQFILFHIMLRATERRENYHKIIHEIVDEMCVCMEKAKSDYIGTVVCLFLNADAYLTQQQKILSGCKSMKNVRPDRAGIIDPSLP